MNWGDIVEILKRAGASSARAPIHIASRIMQEVRGDTTEGATPGETPGTDAGNEASNGGAGLPGEPHGRGPGGDS